MNANATEPTPFPGLLHFLGETKRLYLRHFRLFIGLILPALILGYLIVTVARQTAFEISRRTLGQGPFGATDEWLPIRVWALVTFGLLAEWVLFCFCFAATAVAVARASAAGEPEAQDCIASTKEKGAPILKVSLLLFSLVAFMVSAAMFVGLTSMGVVSRFASLPQTVGLAGNVGFGITWLLGLGVMSQFSMAIPVLMMEKTGVWGAMRRSWALADGRLGTLFVLVLESLIGSYFAVNLPYWYANAILRADAGPWWLDHFLWLIALIGVALVQPLMLIGFSLVYCKTSRQAVALGSNEPGVNQASSR